MIHNKPKIYPGWGELSGAHPSHFPSIYSCIKNLHMKCGRDRKDTLQKPSVTWLMGKEVMNVPSKTSDVRKFPQHYKEHMHLEDHKILQ